MISAIVTFQITIKLRHNKLWRIGVFDIQIIQTTLF